MVLEQGSGCKDMRAGDAPMLGSKEAWSQTEPQQAIHHNLLQSSDDVSQSNPSLSDDSDASDASHGSYGSQSCHRAEPSSHTRPDRRLGCRAVRVRQACISGATRWMLWEAAATWCSPCAATRMRCQRLYFNRLRRLESKDAGDCPTCRGSARAGTQPDIEHLVGIQDSLELLRQVPCSCVSPTPLLCVSNLHKPFLITWPSIVEGAELTRKLSGGK